MAIKPGNIVYISDWVNANDQGDLFIYFTQTGKSKRLVILNADVDTQSSSCIYTQKRLAENRPIW